ncbi:phage tail protein [Serratia fonticola]|uniref:phage tail-collar fiber domain-containing protein n=1 Tax=Serratia fonticola TaxID=47917 RepID=UPI003AFFF10D
MANNMYYSILTTVGTEKLAQAIITEIPVRLTTIAIGDGNGQFYSPTPDQTQLKRETWRGDVNDLRSAEDAANHVLAEGVVPTNVGGWTIREVGLFDDFGDLIAVGNYPDTIKPMPTSGSGKQLYIQIHLLVDNIAALELIIDDSIVIASRKYVDDLDKKHRADLASSDGGEMIGTKGGLTVQQSLDSIQQSLDTKEITIGTTDLVYSASFRSNAYPYVQIAIGVDGVRFTKTFVPRSYDPTTTDYDNNLFGRDPSILWHDGYFYVSVTNYTAGSHDIVIWRSANLTDWVRFTCKLGTTPIIGRYVAGHPLAVARVWAPELMIVNNELHVAVSLNCEPNVIDKNGTSVPSFRPFWSRCVNISTLSFSEPVEFNLPTQLNRIDPDVMYDPKVGKYVMAIKNEIYKFTEIYFSPSFSGVYSYIGQAPFSADNEGASLMLLPTGLTRLYVDFYTSTNGIRYLDTSDYVSWGTEGSVSTAPARHGTFRRVSSDHRELLALLRAATLAPDTQAAADVTMQELPDGATDLIPQNGCVYWVGSSHVATLTLSPGGRHFFIGVRSSLSNAAIIITNTTTGVETFGYGDINRFYELAFDSRTGRYAVVGGGGVSVVTNLVTNAGTQNINAGGVITWFPKYGWTYQVSGEDRGTTVINALPTNLPNGFHFYLRVDSASNVHGLIALTGGGAGFNFKNTITLDGSTGLDGKFVEVRKVGVGFSVSAF